MNAVAFTITPSGAAVIRRASSDHEQLSARFDAAFLERRMQQHRELQERPGGNGAEAMNTPLIPTLRLELLQIPPADATIFEPLHISIEWMRYCEPCDSEQRFVANTRCPSGLIAHCAKCGDRRLVPYSRTNSDGWEAYT